MTQPLFYAVSSGGVTVAVHPSRKECERLASIYQMGPERVKPLAPSSRAFALIAAGLLMLVGMALLLACGAKTLMVTPSVFNLLFVGVPALLSLPITPLIAGGMIITGRRQLAARSFDWAKHNGLMSNDGLLKHGTR